MINFPSSPTLNQEYSFGNRVWKYNGTGWALKIEGVSLASSDVTGALGYAPLSDITSTDGSVAITATGTTKDLSVSVAGATNNVVANVRNTTGVTLTKGTAVFINGATGQQPTVAKALATSDATSAQTLGLVTADISNNSNGQVTIIGLISNVDTSAYTDGAQLYLSPTTAGELTATKPSAPNHMVYCAVVEHAHATQGKLFVKVQNGYELDELHDVKVSSVAANDFIVRDSNNLWVNQTPSAAKTSLGLAVVASSGSYTDLDDKPTIPAAQVSSDWDATTGVAQILNKPTTISGYGITDAQAKDANLTAIAALTGTSGLLKKTAADTWALDTTTYAPADHEHDASDIITGTLDTARLGSGTASNTTFLRGDQTWATIPSGGASSIDGLSDAAKDSTSMLIGQNTIPNVDLNATAVGVGALANSGLSSTNNTAVGFSSLSSVGSGSGNNTAVGANALLQQGSLTGNNTAVGSGAMSFGSNGSNNVAIGFNALNTNPDGGHNVVIGANALPFNGLGSDNVVLGFESMINGTDGSGNVVIGRDAGATISTGSNNIVIGKSANTSGPSVSNEVTIGSTDITATRLRGAIFVGNTTPNAGTTGQVLTSSGDSTEPVWAAVPASGATDINGLSDAASGNTSIYLGRNTVPTGSFDNFGNTAVGIDALQGANPGTSHVAVGTGALQNATDLGNSSTAVGAFALNSITLSNSHTAVGAGAMQSLTSGTNNVAVGSDNMSGLAGGSSNTSIGAGAMNNTSSSTASNNTVVGTSSLNKVTGSSNTVLGAVSGKNLTSGQNNVFIGKGTATDTTTGSNNIVIGANASPSSNTVDNEVTIGDINITATRLRGAILVGNSTPSAGTSGQVLTSTGSSSAPTWTTVGGGGASSLDGLTDVFANTTNMQLGVASTYATSGARSTSLGIDALSSQTSGSDNTAVGYQALKITTTGTGNTALGKSSMAANISGNNGTAFGFESLMSNTTGANNTAVGVNSLRSNTTAINNTAVGYNSLFSNTTGHSNVSIGGFTMIYNTSGVESAALGYGALQQNTTGEGNTALGFRALTTNTIGSNNVAIGRQSLDANTEGSSNVAIGWNTLGTNTTGIRNVAIGQDALGSVNVGSNNTAIGHLAGFSLTTGANNTVIGNGASASAASVSNQVTLGNASVNSLRCQVTSITALSDERDKKDWDYNIPGVDFVMDLEPAFFKWNTRDGAKVDIDAAGFSAQKLLAVQEKHNAAPLDLVSTDNPDKLEARYGNLIPVLVKAIQDQQKQIEELKAQVNDLQIQSKKS